MPNAVAVPTVPRRAGAALSSLLFALPFPELMFRAQGLPRQHFDLTKAPIAGLLSIRR